MPKNTRKKNQDQDSKFLVEKIQKDPVYHVEFIQGVKTLVSYQSQILDAIQKYDRVCIRSCHDMGKTFVMAKAVLWFGNAFDGSKIITTAPTFKQVRLLLWSEIRSGYSKSIFPLGGQMNQTEWKIKDDWFAYGFTSKPEVTSGEGQGTASGFQGFHGKYILVIFDEATGISRQIWNQVEGLLTSANVKFVAIGNPTSKNSDFYKCFQDPAWHKIKISCFDSPNLIANNIKHIADLEDELSLIRTLSDLQKEERLNSYQVVAPQLITMKWVVSMAIKWGIDHPLFVSKVLGEFPDEDDNVLISLKTVEDAQTRWQDLKESNKFKDPVQRVIGVDCARYGPDKTVIVMFEDNFMKERIVLAKSSITQIVGHVTNLINSTKRCNVESILIDGTGLGSGVVDGLIENINNKTIRPTVAIREIHFGVPCENPDDKSHFGNVKAKMFKILADALKKDLAIFPEQVYLEELPTIRYEFTPKGQLVIESKDDYKHRTGMGSPDDSDALALAAYGLMDNGNVGEWTESMVKQPQLSKPLAGGLKSGDHW